METLLRLPQVIARTTRSKPSIYADIKAGRFPAPVKIGIRAVAWRSTDLEAWSKGLVSAAVQPAPGRDLS